MNGNPNALAELHSTAIDLAARVATLTSEWNAVAEVGVDLGVDVHNAGTAVMALLDDIAKAAKGDALRTRRLAQEAVKLGEAIEFYEQLDEHEFDASLDIFDRLGPATALAHTALTVLRSP